MFTKDRYYTSKVEPTMQNSGVVLFHFVLLQLKGKKKKKGMIFLFPFPEIKEYKENSEQD